MKRTITILLVIALLICNLVSAQVRSKIFQKEMPESMRPARAFQGSVIDIPVPAGFESLKSKTAANIPVGEEKTFGISIDTDIDVIKQSTRYEEGGTATYSLTIKAKGALNINVQFSEFELPENAILTIYTRREITDSISAEQNNENRLWATKVYQGGELSFRLSIPVGMEDGLALKIGNVGIGYKPYGYDFGNIDGSAPCMVNVVCPEGNGWEPERNSVAMIVSGGIEQCTGAMVMNACSSTRPFFLTANHCLDGNQANWVFQFQTWSTQCAFSIGWIETVQFNGATLRANNDATDFALLELNTTPAANSGIHYAGWTRQVNGNTSTTVIHHPAGDLMKISRDNNAPTAITDVNGGVSRLSWRLDLDLGRVQGGSSGAPYFNQDHRIIGQHMRRPQVNQLPVCDITVTVGPRFDQSWTGGGTNATRLSNWLDPFNTGLTTTNTTNINALQNMPTTAFAVTGPTQFCTSAQYTLPNFPANIPITWIVTSIYGQQSHSVSNNVLTVNRVTDGSCQIQARYNICGATNVFATPLTVNVGGSVITATATQIGCDEAQFTVNNAPMPNTFNWSSNGNTILYNGVSTTDVTTTPSITGYAVNDIAVVQTTNSCGQSVVVGADYFPYLRNISGLYPEYPNCGEHISVSVNTTPYDTYYRWYVNNVLVGEGSSAYFYCTCYYGPDGRHYGDNTIRVEVDTYCGANTYTEGNFWFPCGWYRTGQLNVELFPNPARGQVTVRLKDLNEKKTEDILRDIREIRVTDKLGNVRKVLRYTPGSKSVNVDVSLLPLDIYILEVSDGKNKARLQLSVQK